MTWQTTPLIVLGLVLVAAFAWYERRRPPAKVIALVAAMAALAVVGRLAFAAIPNVKPTTDIVLFSGFALGAVPGFVVGAVTALVSNVFLGHGPWTVWQMVAWGGVGVGGALLAALMRGREPGRLVLALACGAAGLGFGLFMDAYQWTLAAEQTAGSYAAVAGSSLAYNLAHAIGNVAFCLLMGPLFVRSLRRYRRRFEVTWPEPRAALPSAAGTGAAALVVAVVLGAGAGAPEAQAATPRAKAVRYLERVQNRDGGFGGAPGQASSPLFTGWSALGLAAAGRNPRDVSRPRGRAVTRYLRRARIRDTGELERTILVLRAAGLSVRRFGGRDLVARLVSRRRSNGSWQGNVAFTAFGILALRAAGQDPGSASLQRSADWLAGAQNRDGGFGFVPRAESDADDTGAALQALASVGRRGGPATRAAVGYLRRMQNGDGGLGQSEGRSSNAQSTAWAVQGLVAAGVRPESLGGPSPLRYLVRLQRRDGHFAYSAASDQTPVWVTAQALTALRRRPFPLAAVPRRRTARAATPEAAGARSVGAGRRGSTSKRRRSRDDGERGAAPAPGPQPRGLRPAPGAVGSEPASAARVSGEEEGKPVSAAVVIASLAAALLMVGLARRRLRARRPA